MIDLYHWEPNSFSLMPLVALHEKGLPFTSHYVDWTSLAPMNGPSLNLEALNNPENEGPILLDGSAVISESFFMLEYLDDAYPGGLALRPPDAAGKWRVRVWGRFLGERTAPAVATLGCHRYLAPVLKGRDLAALERLPTEDRRIAWRNAIEDRYSAEELADSARRAAEVVQRIEEALDTASWLLPSGYSAADIAAFALTSSLTKLTPELCNPEVAPRMTEWLARMRGRPAVQAALAVSRTGRPDEAFAPGPDHARWG